MTTVCFTPNSGCILTARPCQDFGIVFYPSLHTRKCIAFFKVLQATAHSIAAHKNFNRQHFFHLQIQRNARHFPRGASKLSDLSPSLH